MANLNPKFDHLIPTAWKPGESGNPKGRPKRPDMNAALDQVITESPELLKKLVDVGIDRALSGDFRYWQAIYDRLNGKVPTPTEQIDSTSIDWSELDNEGDTTESTDTEGA